jgi:hypothetical protein
MTDGFTNVIVYPLANRFRLLRHLRRPTPGLFYSAFHPCSGGNRVALPPLGTYLKRFLFIYYTNDPIPSASTVPYMNSPVHSLCCHYPRFGTCLPHSLEPTIAFMDARRDPATLYSYSSHHSTWNPSAVSQSHSLPLHNPPQYPPQLPRQAMPRDRCSMP